MIEHLGSEDFAEQARGALQDVELRGALDRATDTFSDRRGRAVREIPDWEDLREQARRIKADVLEHLDQYLEAFVERAEAAGMIVHWAVDGKQACEIVSRLARERVAHTIVKSKSMTTEEIGLNDALEHLGLVPVETDLGEWIIQLAGEKPSHIIVPAIHKTREQIASLFQERLGTPATDDVEELAGIARGILRKAFAEADMGVSGVNFAIAETGSFLVLENEGNARMSTTLPRVHVAMMGIEKVLPRLADLEIFLRLLPRSGTGQHLTSYQTLFTGVDASGEGPEEIHVVLLDNGRSEMLREEVTRQSLACIRCGACLNACPVYRQIGGHAYGSVYPGPIGAVITPQLAGLERAAELPFASSLCSACRDVCPVKIDIPRLLLDLRSKIIAGRKRSPRPGGKRRVEALGFRLWAFAMRRAWRYRLAARLSASLLPRTLGDGRLARTLRRILGPVGAWTAGRDLPLPSKKSFRQLWSESRRGKGDEEAA